MSEFESQLVEIGYGVHAAARGSVVRTFAQELAA
jgi:hypothetical protein